VLAERDRLASDVMSMELEDSANASPIWPLPVIVRGRCVRLLDGDSLFAHRVTGTIALHHNLGGGTTREIQPCKRPR
jgi:hypothetical protein